MTFSPRFSPDGQKVVMSLSEGATTNLYAMDLRSRTTTRLTDSGAIDTSPCYSPDGSQIVFESDRGGSQQIYVMGASGGGGQAHLVRRRALFDAGMVAQGRFHRLHQAESRQFRHRRDEARRLGRAHPDRGLPQRRADLGAQRPVPDVLPRSRRRGRARRSSWSTCSGAASSRCRRPATPPTRLGAVAEVRRRMQWYT